MLRDIETNSIGITTQLHVPQLQPCPVCVKLSGPDEGEMHSQTTMHCRAVDAQENAVCYAGPCRILRVAIKTRLKEKEKMQM